MKRVVVTGMGIVSPIGNDVAASSKGGDTHIQLLSIPYKEGIKEGHFWSMPSLMAQVSHPSATAPSHLSPEFSQQN